MFKFNPRRLVLVLTFLLVIFGVMGQTAFANPVEIESRVRVYFTESPLLPPLGLTASPFSSTAILLSWLPPSDTERVVGYYLYRGSTKLNNTTNLSYLDENLLPLTGYSYYLTSFDSEGIESDPTAVVWATTTSAGGGPVIPILGCSDPLATNYDPQVTEDDGSCQYPILEVPNAVKFTATYNQSLAAIDLVWINSSSTFSRVVIVRRIDRFPSSPTDGLVVYSGVGKKQVDNFDLQSATKYFYTLFVVEASDRYSSGLVATAFTPDKEEPQGEDDEDEIPTPVPIPGCLDPLALNYQPTATFQDDSCRYALGVTPTILPGPTSASISTTSPFLTGESVLPLKIITETWLLRFSQPDEKIKTFDRQQRVRLVGNKSLTILFNSAQAPAGLKIIGVTLTDPVDPNLTFSFLLRENQAGTAYEATLAPFGRLGKYLFDLYLVDYDRQIINHTQGELLVDSGGIFSATTLEKVSVPAVTSGLLVGALPSLYDLLIIFFRTLPYLFGRRRRQPWGTVYDSVTKRPLDPAYVSVKHQLTETKEITSAITDIDGRFGFLLPAGIYYLIASKTHYRFPSERLAGRSEDELYADLYFGQQLETTGAEVVNLNIPMDPLDFDWNEFAKTKTDFFKFYRRRDLWLGRLWRVTFFSGFVFSFYSLFIYPSVFNVILFGGYGLVWSADKYWHQRRRPQVVRHRISEEPLPFAIIRVWLPSNPETETDLRQQIKSLVADQFGRFYLLVRPGLYVLTVDEKMPDGSYRRVLHSKILSLPKGVLTDDLLVD